MSTHPAPGAQPGHTFAPQGPDAYATAPQGTQPPGPPPGYGPGPGVPPQQNGPGGVPPQQRKSWFARHKILSAILAVVALIMLVNALSGGGEEEATAGTDTAAGADAGPDPAGAPDGAGAQGDAVTPEASAPEGATEEPAADAAAGLGDAVRDGKFEFTVTGIETGVAEVGDEYFGEKAQGQFVLVQLTVSNIGDRPQTLFGDNQTLLDEQGREHSANTMAGIYLDDNDTFVNEINPGNTVEGTVVFDIPADAVPVSIELHDSAFSGGVSVDLQ